MIALSYFYGIEYSIERIARRHRIVLQLQVSHRHSQTDQGSCTASHRGGSSTSASAINDPTRPGLENRSRAQRLIQTRLLLGHKLAVDWEPTFSSVVLISAIPDAASVSDNGNAVELGSCGPLALMYHRGPSNAAAATARRVCKHYDYKQQ